MNHFEDYEGELLDWVEVEEQLLQEADMQLEKEKADDEE